MFGIILYIVANMAIVFTISILLSLLGIRLDSNLILFAIIFGFSGSFLSLLMSKWMAKTAVGAVVIANPSNSTERFLVNTIRELAARAQIGMPEVAMYDGSPNAFATGYDRNNALVAVSSGLIESMDKDALKAVLAHEIAHIKNGDMITMSLLQGLINTFVIIFSRLLASVMTKNNERPSFALQMIIEVVLSFLGAIIVFWFSRHREYKADETSSNLFSANAMILALQSLKREHTEPLPDSMKTFGFVGFFSLFSTHPSLDDRIENLKNKFNIR